MDRYQKVQKVKGDRSAISENELRVTAQGRMRNYMSYALSLLQDKGSDDIVLKATGRAISKTVMIAELLKRRVIGLHQNTTIGSVDITDTWEPLEEGLLPLETTRHVSVITITLSKKELDSSLIGYQAPIPADQVKPLADFDEERGNDNGAAEQNNGGWDGGNGYEGRGRGRGRGRARGRGGPGYRGRGRGFGGAGDMNQETGYYNGHNESVGIPLGQEGRGRGRGRARAPGRGRGRGRDQRQTEGPRSDGPVEAQAAA